MLEWLDDEYNPDYFNLIDVNKKLKKLSAKLNKK